MDEVLEPILADVSALGAQAVADEVVVAFQFNDTKQVFRLRLNRGDAFLLSRNIQDAIEDSNTPS